MRSIEYPNAVADLVVIEFRGRGLIGFTVRPVLSGLYRLVIWPEGLPDPDLFAHVLLNFDSAESEPLHALVNMAEANKRPFELWRWALLSTSESSTPLDDFTRAVTAVDIVTTSQFSIPPRDQERETRFVAWSCHQPYESEGNRRAVFQKDAEAVLNWYASEVIEFNPHVIWGQGDTSYSDGTEATDFSNQVYDQGAWYRNLGNRIWLQNEYRNMYRHFWSLPPMRQVMSNYPHLFIWDDHEIHDGWGSEGKDFQVGNYQMFQIAKAIADEYILNAGPRVRPNGPEAHQAYIMGPLAAFIFDTRSTRNYEAPRDRLISNQQFEDFQTFLRTVRNVTSVSNLVTCTTVPFVGLRTWATKLASRAPDVLNDSLLSGVRDDVRDSWTSPGNIDTLTRVLSEIRSFMNERPDVRVSNVSGDIHVANAFEIHFPGALHPIYQITTSAITNRTHPPELVAYLTEIPDMDYIEGVGDVQRIWNTVTDPNILLVRVESGIAEFNLKVWVTDESGAKDLSLSI